MQDKKIKLTPKQKEVIKALQDDFILITGNDMKGADVAKGYLYFHITNRVFWNLVDKGLIYQTGQEGHFNFELTPLGKSIPLD